MFSFATKSSSDNRPSSLTLISSNDYSNSFTLPDETEVGDIAIIWEYLLQFNAGISDSIPSGFTKIITTYRNVVNVYIRGTSSFKVVTSSDLNTTFTGFNGTFSVLIFRCPKNITSAAIAGTPSGTSIYNQSGSINQSIDSGTARSVMIGVNNWTSSVKLNTETGSWSDSNVVSYYLNNSGNITNSYSGSYSNNAPNSGGIFQSYQINLSE